MKEFLGVPVNAKIKQQIANNVYDNTTFNKINTNLDKYRVVLATLDSLGVLDGNTENISKLYTSNATKTVKKEIANYSFQKGGSVNTAKPNTTKNTDNYLKSVTQQMEKNDPFKFTKLY